VRQCSNKNVDILKGRKAIRWVEGNAGITSTIFDVALKTYKFLNQRILVMFALEPAGKAKAKA
jgi:hypothetical protein